MNGKVKVGDIYGNHEMYSPPIEGHPNGVLMFRNKRKRIQWYLDRKLAKLIKEENGVMTAQMLVMPNGLGRHGDPYMPIMQNRCVVTGNSNNLNRHHIVPKQYRNLMPLYYKELCYHDIVAIDIDTHNRYEIEHANLLKRELSIKYDAPLYPKDFGDDYNLSKLAFAYENHNELIPDEKKNYMLDKFKTYFNKSMIDKSDIEYLISLKPLFDEKIANHGKIVLESFNDNQGFVEMWRQHFLDTMKPGFMPEDWSVNRAIDIVQTYRTEFDA